MASRPLAAGLAQNFLGAAPGWYKTAILSFLALNPFLLVWLGPFVTGWLLVAGLLIVAGTLLILPAIYLGVVFVASLYGVVVVERRGIGRCFALVNPRLLPTFGRILLAVGAYFAFLATVDVLVSVAGAGPVATTVVQVAAGSVVGVVGVAVAVVTYAELRAGERPGVSTATFAAQLVA